MPRGVGALDEARLQGRLWSPRVLNPTLWVKANAPGTLTVSGTTVTGVTDAASGAAWTVAGSIGRDLTQLGGLPTLRLNNATENQILTIAQSYAGNGITLVSLHRNRSTSGRIQYGRLFSLWRATFDYASNDGGILTYGVTGTNGVAFYRAGAITAQTSPLINDVWGCVVATRSGTSVTMSLDGGTRTTGTTAAANFNFGNVRIGNDDGPRADSGMDGYIAENLLITRALSLPEELALTGYLAWEWGRVGTLPAAHPFRNRPPLIGD
ncbi:MAG: LamG-like jellyroll fold domain-containing protein [Betaproteobacteria bacterium]|jgi:hypothetical protein